MQCAKLRQASSRLSDVADVFLRSQDLLQDATASIYRQKFKFEYMRTVGNWHLRVGLAAAISSAALFLTFPLSAAAQAQGSAAGAVSSSSPQADSVYEARYAGLSMGTIVSAKLYAADEKTAAGFADAFEAKVAEYEKLFTVHGDGPLNEVNKNAGQWVPVDCRIAALVQTAKTIAQKSDRAFEPTIGTLVNVWKIGFGGDKHPKQEDIKKALEKVDYKRIAVDETPGACRVRIDAGQSLDLGAIAKGWIGSALVQDMKRIGADHGIIDLGGNVALIANNPSGQNWRIGVQRPDAERNTILAVLEASAVSVITSGAYERKIESAGKTYGHILSAVTGEPAATDLASVTIVNADGAAADGWCTALFAMGSKKALAAAEREKLSVILVSSDLKTLWVSRSIADNVKVLDKSMTIKVVP